MKDGKERKQRKREEHVASSNQKAEIGEVVIFIGNPSGKSMRCHLRVYPRTRSQICQASYGYLVAHESRTDFESTGSTHVLRMPMQIYPDPCTSMHPDGIRSQRGKSLESFQNLNMLALQ